MASSMLTRVKLSLADIPVKRLIVCLGCGDYQKNEARGALGNRVAQQILGTCAPAPSDIHNPDKNRLHARNAHGRARQNHCYHRGERFFRGMAVNGLVRSRGSIRSPQVWDSEPVVDYMGLWCDRLLLGEHTNPSRCALLEPRAPFVMVGESLERVLLAHRNFQGADILFVFASSCFPFGALRLVSFNDALLNIPRGGPSVYQHNSIGTILNRLALSSDEASAIVMGVGDTHGLLVSLTAEERAMCESRILPLVSFAAALWTVNPAKAREYLQSNPKDNMRLWRTMQSSMLSTRDTAVLRAYESGRPLDARISQRQTIYLAETLLSRLFPDDAER
ncbi:hypothetical protein C3747_19g259 [Trypanosoma cruzi]|uniref:Uncharacterized protein n=2 Tax=Trypanosoma cruzi TaxID=5693 RepID=Q4CZ28_TRYCC|nr:hypothetical protein, conserved [Trypanosoma cruzi]EAN85530.1 hypothetical protein, conserved [Trypanosoma cruzi]PWV17321.1 hypothetical protein C3747_19g259 [Trypanosoma cruzi]RNC59546.1 hypothetical protein TcCL_ESM02744 [Trypanosoma cruzi]|eukprot:XP_807381.1 hypothetical protein [Trypanosoma cruzi strain CL Brener]